MQRITTGLSALLLIASCGIAAAQQADRPSETVAYVLCAGDYVCADDPSVVAAWPLERWASVRRQGMPASSTTSPQASSGQQQLAGRLDGLPNPTSP